jgi:hypothetical protein
MVTVHILTPQVEQDASFRATFSSDRSEGEAMRTRHGCALKAMSLYSSAKGGGPQLTAFMTRMSQTVMGSEYAHIAKALKSGIPAIAKKSLCMHFQMVVCSPDTS